MELRRCPSCTNLINPQSAICPICGLSYVQAIVRRIAPWAILVLVVLGVGVRFVG